MREYIVEGIKFTCVKSESKKYKYDVYVYSDKVGNFKCGRGNTLKECQEVMKWFANYYQV